MHERRAAAGDLARAAGISCGSARDRCGAVRRHQDPALHRALVREPRRRPSPGTAGRRARACSTTATCRTPGRAPPRSATDRPRAAASSAMPAPVTPPPITSRSTTSPPASASSSAARRAALSECCAGCWRGAHGRSATSSRWVSSVEQVVEREVGGRRPDREHVRLQQQEDRPRLHRGVGRRGSSRPACPAASLRAQELLGHPLARADALHDVGQQHLGVPLDHRVHQRVRGEARIVCTAATTSCPRAVGSGCAIRFASTEDLAELAGDQGRQHAAHVGEAPVERHPADARRPRDVAQRGAAHADRQHALHRRVEQYIVCDAVG